MQSSLFDHTSSTPELEEIDWSFKGAKTNYYTHNLHKYPARMIPQIPKTLFDHWLAKGTLNPQDLVFDPFCGSGTTATEARLHDLNAIATDINPFACLLARTKSTELDTEKLTCAIKRCLGTDWRVREQFIEQDHSEATERHPVQFGSDIYPNDLEENRNHDCYSVKKGWFPEPQISKIEAMSRFLSELRAEYDYKIIRFIRIALSQTAREISYQRKSEFKRHRIPEEERSSHNPPFVETFYKHLSKNLEAIKEYSSQVHKETASKILLNDCRDPSVLSPNSVDCIVTSPPYGDHRTTVAYGGFSKSPTVASFPIKADQMKDVDPSGLGGHRSESSITFDTVLELSSSLELTVNELKSVEGRDADVLSFFADYAQTIKQMSRVIKAGQPVAIVVGNRTVSRIPIPMHLITTEIALELGLSHQHTLPRSIPSKTLPYENAPENIPGETGGMIADEYILIFNGTTTT